MVEQLKTYSSSLTHDLLQFKKNQGIVSQEIETSKQQKSDVAEKLTSNEFLINNLKQDCQRLKSRIVANPEKLKQAINEMNQSLKEDKLTANASERKARELQSKIDMLNQVEQDTCSCIALLNEAHSVKQNKQEMIVKLESEQEQRQRKEADIQELTMQEQQLRRQQSGAKDKLARLEQHQESKQDIWTGKMLQLKSEYDQVLMRRKKAQAEADVKDAEIAEIEDKDHETDIKTLESEYKHMTNTLSKYQTVLVEAIQAPL